MVANFKSHGAKHSKLYYLDKVTSTIILCYKRCTFTKRMDTPKAVSSAYVPSNTEKPHTVVSVTKHYCNGLRLLTDGLKENLGLDSLVAF